MKKPMTATLTAGAVHPGRQSRGEAWSRVITSRLVAAGILLGAMTAAWAAAAPDQAGAAAALAAVAGLLASVLAETKHVPRAPTF